MFDVITVGSATVDVFACTEQCPHLGGKAGRKFVSYPIGSKILVEELNISTGGGATNTAVALARLGMKVACLTKIGSKDNSGRVISDLKKEGINTSLVIQNPYSRTGYSIILDSFQHDRTILTFRGSNSDLGFNEIPLHKLKTKWFYFSSMKGKSFRTLEKLSAFAVNQGIQYSLTLNPVLAKQGIPALKKLLRDATIVIMNKEECLMLVGKGTLERNFKKLRRIGPKIIAITDGKEGVSVYADDTLYFGKPRRLSVVETTGAGDAFAASFLAGYIEKGDIAHAIEMGMTNAESVIQYHGAKNKLLSRREILNLMKKKPHKITARKTHL